MFESKEQESQIAGLAAHALEHPKAKDWFSGEWQLYNERSIIFTDGNGEMQVRRPDRVMVKDGQVVVVDFKFGKKSDAYRTQVQEYMRLLEDMGYSHVEGYLWYVFSNETERVDREVPDRSGKTP